jgi:hypothetical protein
MSTLQHQKKFTQLLVNISAFNEQNNYPMKLSKSYCKN